MERLRNVPKGTMVRKWCSLAADLTHSNSILRYADDTTLMVERGEELKSFSMQVKEESEKLA